jgi:predicted kinase
MIEIKAYIILGSTGAGKSTYSKEISKKNNSLIFSIDEWMKKLYWMDAPKENTLDWALERVKRCENQIWCMALQTLSKGNSVILDLGFSKKEQRESFYKLLNDADIPFEIHFLDIDATTRWKRVEERNSLKTDTYQFDVNKETFDWMEGYFERPDLDELEKAIIITE